MKISAASKELGKLLLANGMTLAIAESCTGGLLGARLTEVAGSSAYFMGGVISYDNRIKNEILKVPFPLLRKYGAVSRETVLAMARGVRKLMGVDCAIAVSGIAGPFGGTPLKPVGLVYIGIAVKKECRAHECRFMGTRKSVREQSVQECLRLMIEAL